MGALRGIRGGGRGCRTEAGAGLCDGVEEWRNTTSLSQYAIKSMKDHFASVLGRAVLEIFSTFRKRTISLQISNAPAQIASEAGNLTS